MLVSSAIKLQTSDNMLTKSDTLRKLFTMHGLGCFGAAHRNDEEIGSDQEPQQPRTPNRLPRLFRSKEPIEPEPEEPEPEWKVGDGYEDIKNLQHGTEAKTHVTKCLRSEKIFVVKRFKRYDVLNELAAAAVPKGEQPGPNEAFVLLRVLGLHPNILRAFGCEMFGEGKFFGEKTGERIANLYTQYCTGGDLMEQIERFHRVRRLAPERFVLHTFISLGEALLYIHSGLRYDPETNTYVQQESDSDKPHPGIVHADIKPENVFLHWSDEAKERGMPDVVLGDFGAAQPEHLFKGIAGTEGYQAPEVAAAYKLKRTDRPAFRMVMQKPGTMTKAADVWSLGQTMHMLCTGRQHVVGADPMTLPVERMEHGVIGVKLGGRHGYDTEALQRTVQWCLQPDPAMRPKITEGSLAGALLIMRDALAKREKNSPKIHQAMWASYPKPEAEAKPSA